MRPGHTPTSEERAAIVEYGCGICLDFGYLPGLGPCPHCRPDEHAEFVAVLLEQSSVKGAAA